MCLTHDITKTRPSSEAGIFAFHFLEEKELTVAHMAHKQQLWDTNFDLLMLQAIF